MLGSTAFSANWQLWLIGLVMVALPVMLFLVARGKPSRPAPAPAPAPPPVVHADPYFDEMRDELDWITDRVRFAPFSEPATFWVLRPYLFDVATGRVIRHSQALPKSIADRIAAWMDRYEANSDFTDPEHPVYFPTDAEAASFLEEHRQIVEILIEDIGGAEDLEIAPVTVRVGPRPAVGNSGAEPAGH